MELWHTLVIEWHFAAYQDIENDSETPNIYFWACVDFRVEEFWCSEIQRTTERRQMCQWIIQIGQAEVDDLDVAGLRYEDVLNLEV